MKKARVNEYVYSESYTHETVRSFIDRINAISGKLSIPLDKLIIESDVEHDYGDSTYPRLRIYYEREETDAEFNARKKVNDEWEARRIADAKKVLGLA